MSNRVLDGVPAVEAILHTLAASIQPVESLTAVSDGGWCSRTGFSLLNSMYDKYIATYFNRDSFGYLGLTLILCNVSPSF